MSEMSQEGDPWTATEAIAFLAFGDWSQAAEAPRRQGQILARWHPSPDYIQKLFIESDEVGLDGLGGEYLGLLELRKMEITKKAQRRFEWAEIRALLVDDLAWMDKMRDAARYLVSACRAGLVEPWGIQNGSGQISRVPRECWLRGFIISRDAMSRGEGSMEEFVEAQKASPQLFRRLEFDPQEVRSLRQPQKARIAMRKGSLASAQAFMMSLFADAEVKGLPRPKRADAITRCRDGVDVSHRTAEEALKAVPQERRNPPGRRKRTPK